MQPGKPPELPSGEQFEIRHGNQRAVVVEVGAGLRLYEVDGQPVLDGYAEDEMVASGRGAILAPWPNRLRDGSYEFAGQKYQLPITEVDRHHANHGLVRWANWTCAGHDADRVRMALTLHPQPGYPFCLAFTAEYTLSDAGLEVGVTAVNIGERRAPYGIGHHPYLTAGTSLVDDASLSLPASAYFEVDDRLIPTGKLLPVDGTAYDFRQPKRIGELVLDTPYAQLARDDDGLARVRLSGQRTVTLWLDSSFYYVQAFTGDTVTPSRRRQGLAIEPMSCAPDAFNNGLGLRVLEPGESLPTTWGISVS
ncbi:MAG TPA: aldose 1-epimerase family protein [Chloroflexota bacterium]|nr:aldose 1-epimerase family protein [Chloroflexota bacterium]